MTSDMPAASQMAAGMATFILDLLSESDLFGGSPRTGSGPRPNLPLRSPGFAALQKQKHQQAGQKPDDYLRPSARDIHCL
jgi:hypothetical protein